MTNSLWVTMHILWKVVSSHLLWWPTVCELHCTFCESKKVSSHLLLWPTASECHWCIVCERQSHHIICYYQQQVSDTAHFVKGNFITSFPTTHSKWVVLHILWMEVLSHFSYNPKPVSDIVHFVAIFSYDHQEVSDIAYFVKGSLITSFLMTNR